MTDGHVEHRAGLRERRAPPRGDLVLMGDASVRTHDRGRVQEGPAREAQSSSARTTRHMATVYVNNKPVDIGNEQAEPHPGGQQGRRVHSALLLAPGPDRRRQLPHVPGRGRREEARRQPCHAAARSCPAARRRPRTAPSSSPTATRPKDAQQQTLEGILLNHPLDCPVCDKAGECMLQDFSYRFGQRQSRMIDDKNTPPNKPHIGDQHHAVHRPLHHVLALRPLHARDQRHGRIAGHQPRQSLRDRHLPRRSAQQQAGQQRRRSLPGRGAVQQGLPVQAARLVPEDRRQRLSRLLAPAAASTSMTTRTSSIACGRARTRRPRAISCATTAGSAITTSTRSSAFRRPHGPARRQAGAATPWTEIVGEIRKRLRATRRRKDAAQVVARAVAVSDLRGSVPAGQVRSRGCRRTCGWRWARCRWSARTTPIPRIAAASRSQPVKFTIRAEKCPNRRGVEEVLRHFQGEVIGFDEVAAPAAAGGAGALPGGRLSAAAGRLDQRRAGRGAAEGAAAGRARICCRRRCSGSPTTCLPGSVVRGEGWHLRQSRRAWPRRSTGRVDAGRARPDRRAGVPRPAGAARPGACTDAAEGTGRAKCLISRPLAEWANSGEYGIQSRDRSAPRWKCRRDFASIHVRLELQLVLASTADLHRRHDGRAAGNLRLPDPGWSARSPPGCRTASAPIASGRWACCSRSPMG